MTYEINIILIIRMLKDCVLFIFYRKTTDIHLKPLLSWI